MLPASVKCSPSPHKYFPVMLSFEIKSNLLMEHKPRSSSLTFLIRDLSLIISFTKMKKITTYSTT